MSLVKGVPDTTRASVEDRVKQIVGELSKTAPDQIVSSEPLSSISGWDSMSILDLMVHVEREFNVPLDLDALESDTSVSALVDILLAAGGHESA
jgi:acyl carrier protein